MLAVLKGSETAAGTRDQIQGPCCVMMYTLPLLHSRGRNTQGEVDLGNLMQYMHMHHVIRRLHLLRSSVAAKCMCFVKPCNLVYIETDK